LARESVGEQSAELKDDEPGSSRQSFPRWINRRHPGLQLPDLANDELLNVDGGKAERLRDLGQFGDDAVGCVIY
jgi:hypothetical protein